MTAKKKKKHEEKEGIVGKMKLAGEIKKQIFHSARRKISTREATFQKDMERDLARSREEIECKRTETRDAEFQKDVEKALARSEEEAHCKRPELPVAIQHAGLHLKLDADTPGLGNCFSVTMVQQFRRPPVHLFLKSRGIIITSYMVLKRNVKDFVFSHMHTQKIQDLKASFEMSQKSMAEENKDLKPRTWDEYWSDMLLDGQWADDTFIQACAWYTNMNIAIVSADHATPEQPFYYLEGTFATKTTGPTLLVGFVREHYQSLLPLQEDDTKEEPMKSPCAVQERVGMQPQKNVGRQQDQPFTKSPSVPTTASSTTEAVEEGVVMFPRKSCNIVEVIIRRNTSIYIFSIVLKFLMCSQFNQIIF